METTMTTDLLNVTMVRNIVLCDGCYVGGVPHCHIVRAGEERGRKIISGPYIDNHFDATKSWHVMPVDVTDACASINENMWVAFKAQYPDAVRS